MINIVIMGDRSRYSFLGEIVRQIPIPKSKLGDTDIIVTPSNSKEFSADNQAIELKSARLPIATNAILPADNANTQNYAGRAVAVFYFEEFQFSKLKTMRDLEIIRETGFPSVTVVLYAPPRRFLDSDISTYDESIENAKTKYKEDGYKVIEYKSGTNALPLIMQLPTNVSANCHRDRMLNMIAEKRENLYDEEDGLRWDYEWMREDYECGLTEHDKTFITRYDSQEFEIASLDVVYFERARKLIFEKKRSVLIEPLLAVYKNFICGLDFKDFIFWNLSKDVGILEEKIRTQFYKSTFVNHNVIFQGTSIEYGMFEEKIKLCLDFYNRIETFFKETFYEVIVHHIEGRLNKLEELAKGG